MAPISLPPVIAETIERLASGDRGEHSHCYKILVLSLTPDPAWADAAWRQIAPLLRHRDNRVRSISGQALCALAPATSREQILADLEAVFDVTHDEHFVTARHVLLALWQLGASDARLRTLLVVQLCDRFKSCAREKNAPLIRYDIQRVLRRLADVTEDASVRDRAQFLIDLETDAKYRKKYVGMWRVEKK